MPNQYTGPLPLEQRFWSHVTKTDSCWVWIGAKTPKGYGTFMVYPRVRTAHRISWELSVGPIPPKACICHTCDNPSCVRPDHLFIGTLVDNSRDMVRKGRSGIAKVTPEQVKTIRSRYLTEDITQQELGKQFGITKSAVSHIIRYKGWKDGITPEKAYRKWAKKHI